ncbi:TRAP-type C4-dicarboxylate transport system, small permease component [Albimonas donghaensis]|uniref:TRAP transporter small permease protein n=1 Tax=Albimonas donghaensis TaxID=356660 RepID=A0A1H2YAE9_9RHOB|nr:TRAP transporter small permease [Albimonas donghaensis]SDX02183.1 TRAP-type C4-dicarboxylate transport system, small permease component [Albimonas donghaensis]
MSAGPSHPPSPPPGADAPGGGAPPRIVEDIHELTGPKPDAIAPPFPAADRWMGRIASLCMVVAGVQMVVLVGFMGWLVFGRYVLNDTPTWVEQLSLLLIAYITFLGAAIGVRDESHLSIDFIREALPPVPRAILRLLADAMVIVFTAIMAWQGWKLVATNLTREIPMLGVSESWRAASLVAFGVLGAAFAILRLAQRLRAPTRSLPWD